jgi:photosystem II stability/assembly factor-like uncharacterized protein
MSRRDLLCSALLGALITSSCSHPRLARSSSPSAQELERRLEMSKESQSPGRTPHRISPESAKALATLPVESSLGDWRSIGPWIYAGKAYDVAVSPTDPNTVYAAYGSGGGLWKTSDGGNTWLQLTDRNDLTAISCVTAHPQLADVVVACVGGPNNPTPGRGLLYSTDGGHHWDSIGPADGLSSSFYQAVFHPTDPNTIYAASEKGVYRTKDRGAHWNPILTFPGNNPDWFDQMPYLLMKPDDPSVLIVAQDNLGIFRTADGGATWARVDQQIIASAPAGTGTMTSVLAWSPSDTDMVYCERWAAGTQMLTYTSSDAGVTWSSTANLNFRHQGRYDMAMAVDPTNPSRVVVGNAISGVSEDGLRSYH